MIAASDRMRKAFACSQAIRKTSNLLNLLDKRHWALPTTPRVDLIVSKQVQPGPEGHQQLETISTLNLNCASKRGIRHKDERIERLNG